MLSGISVVRGAEHLTSSDLALHDLLISRAYESDPTMSASSYEIPLGECLRFMWSDAREEDVTASMRRMEQVRLSFDGEEGRTFKEVPMLTSWAAVRGEDVDMGYQFPDPIRYLLRNMPSYGYIELAAIGQGRMRSKYSQMLYKRLAHEVSLRRWQSGADNSFTLEFTPAELADLVGFSTTNKSLFSKLQERVISRFNADFLGVQKFDLRITYDGRPEPARGQGVSTSLIQLHVKVHPDTHHSVHCDDRRLKPSADRIGRPDIARYRLNSVFWLQVAKKFKLLHLTHESAYWAWSVALNEAIEGAPLTSGYQRRYRGENLLGAIDANGVEAAAWRFFGEEHDLGADLCNSTHVMKHLGAADRNRLKRLSAKTKGKAKAKPSATVMSPDVVDPVEPVIVSARPTFETCTHVDIEIDHAVSAADLDDYVHATISRETWNGNRKVRLRAYYRVPGTTVRQHFGFWISPADESELLSALRRLDKWMTDTPTYRIEDKDA